jgi:hypothetical protein
MSTIEQSVRGTRAAVHRLQPVDPVRGVPPLQDNTTRVMVQMDFVPEGVLEKVGDAIGAPDRHVKGDLQRFKEMIESRGRESVAWRGQVDRPDEP